MCLNFGIQRPAVIDEGFERMGDTWRALAAEVGDVEAGWCSSDLPRGDFHHRGRVDTDRRRRGTEKCS